MRTPGGQAYAVLTLCRALYSIATGNQASKHVAAAWAATALPDHTDLINWSVRWWYQAGAQTEPDRLPTVARFVEYAAGRIAASPAATQPVC